MARAQAADLEALYKSTGPATSPYSQMLAAAGSTYHVAAAGIEATTAKQQAAAEAEYQLANARLDAALDKASARAGGKKGISPIIATEGRLW